MIRIVLALMILLLVVTSATAAEVLCRTTGNTIVGVSEATIHQAVNLWGQDKTALQVLIDRGLVSFVPPGFEWYVNYDDYDWRAPYRQVRRPGSPDIFWAFAVDFGCPKPEATPAPVDPSPPKNPPKKGKRP